MVPVKVARLSTVESVAISAVTVPSVIASRSFAVVTLKVPDSTIKFWFVIVSWPFSTFVRRVVNADSSPVLIVAPSLRENVVIATSSSFKVFDVSIAKFKSVRLNVLSVKAIETASLALMKSPSETALAKS